MLERLDLDGLVPDRRNGGPDTVGRLRLGIDGCDRAFGSSSVDVSTASGAQNVIGYVDSALDKVNTPQATLGAEQNSFTSAISSLQSQSTNLSAAQSAITDADFAQETANLSKAQVLQQAGISVLAQANSMPQQVLKLLG